MNGQQPVMEKPETIRQWYDRTTSRMRVFLTLFTAIAIVGGVVFFFLVPHAVNVKLQTFNGAITIPISALIWILAFVYIFLVPSREVGFRSQESIEQTVEILNNAVENRIKPALETWQRIGARVEGELNGGLMAEIKASVKELRDAAAKITNSAETSNGEIKKFAEDAKPALDALKRINEKIENNLGGEFVDDLRAAVASVKHMSLPPPDATGPAKEPKVDKALSMISKKPAPKPVIPPPPLVTPAAEAPAPVAVQVPAPAATPVVVVPVAPTPVAAPVPVPQNQNVAPSPIPVMVPTQVAQNQMPVMTQPVAQAASIAAAAPANRFAPAPPPSPVVQGKGQGQGPVQTPTPINSGHTPVQIVLPFSSSQKAPEMSGPHRPSPRHGEVELTLTQKSRPVVVVPVQQQQMGVSIPNGTVPMVGAPQVIQRAEG